MAVVKDYAYLSLAMLNLFNIFDAVLTGLGVGILGIKEINPIMVYSIEGWGLLFSLFVKLWLVYVPCSLLLKIYQSRKDKGDHREMGLIISMTSAPLIGMYFLVTVSNIAAILYTVMN